ncbi:extracellular solute-binding protein [Bordetella sp. LUAb4]|uniref:extracellular solute-binding protein n=1 Tax=Bordetella sp. LUAb4 TaxID=2843195 RepID=UPI001E463DFF|nr:extracellular solute-binding protein [Bordetella sp. LUAb4]
MAAMRARLSFLHTAFKRLSLGRLSSERVSFQRASSRCHASAPSAQRDCARRSFLLHASALGLAPALLGLPGLARAAAQCGNGVLVGMPTGARQALLHEVLDPLLAPAGLVPVYQTASALAQRTRIRAEVGARRPSLDLVVLRDRDLHAIQSEGGLAAIDAQAVPRMAQLSTPFKGLPAITHAWTGLVLVYDKSKFKTPPDSLAALVETPAAESGAGKDAAQESGRNSSANSAKDGTAKASAEAAAKDHIGLLDGMAATLAVAGSLAVGKGAADLEAGRAWLTALHEQGARAYADDAALARAFRHGHVRAALVWRSTVLQWKKDGLDLPSVVPREGLIPALFQAAPVAAGPDRACAAAYLNALLDPTVQQAFAARLYLTPTIDDAALPPETQAVAFAPAEVERIVKRDLDLLARSETDLNTFWSKTFHS